jgi:hypothetical protein
MMPELGRNGDRLPRLQAEVKNAIVLVAGEYEEILALKGLMLTLLRRPAMDMDEVRAELNRFAAVETHYSQIGRESSEMFEKREKWEGEVSRLLDTAFASLSPPQPLAPVSSLILAMATGILVWEQEKSADEPILLVLSVQITDDQTAPGQLIFDQPRAGLLFEPGSLRVRQVLTRVLTNAAGGLKNVVGGSGWFVGIFRSSAGRFRSAEAAALALVENLRKAREKMDPAPIQLPRLDTMSSDALPKTADSIVILFLHGLISTDLGNFDGLIQRLQAPVPADLKRQLPAKVTSEVMRTTFERAVKLVGWPHDTLTSIDQSAHQLSGVIETQLASSVCKLVFICHSRGGLVARATALKLYERADEWADRLCCCITFGTPHAGVGLAEHPDREMGAYMLSGMTQRQLAAYTDIAAYIEQRETIEGIEDLRPASAVGKPFLRSLEENERKIPPPPRGRVRQLQIYGIGGIAPAGDLRQGALRRRLVRYYSHWYSYYLGEANHDLVVPLASATAANDEQIPHIDCDHFSYFSDNSPVSEAVTGAISLIWETTGLLRMLPKPVGRTLGNTVEELTKLLTEMKNVKLQLDEAARKASATVTMSGIRTQAAIRNARGIQEKENNLYSNLRNTLQELEERIFFDIVDAEGAHAQAKLPEVEQLAKLFCEIRSDTADDAEIYNLIDKCIRVLDDPQTHTPPRR